MKTRSLAIIASALMLCACGQQEEEVPAINVITSASSESVTSAVTVTEAVTTTAETEPPPPAEATVSFTALGDNLIHSSIYKQAARRAEADPEKDYDFAFAYEGVADLLDNADITILNQETLICGDDYAPSTYPCFNSPEELGFYMNELGIDVFTIANNHTLDKGETGLEDCLTYYDENGFVRVGAYHNAEDRSNIRVIEKNGVKISFLCYTESLNGLSLSGKTDLEIGRTQDMELIKSEIAAAKEISDICVVSLHWGLENSGEVEAYQRDAAKVLAEAGADAIIGNHPHVLREIEILETSDGRRTLCAYSLGNFISAQSVGTNLIGGILNFDITVSLDGSGRTVIDNMEFIPIVTHYDSNYSNIRLYKLSDYSPELAEAHGVRVNSKFSYDYIIEYLTSKNLYEKN